jgi:hypothetical protein
MRMVYYTQQNQKGVLSMEQVFFKIDENGQMYIDFDALSKLGVAVEVVRHHFDMISQSDKFNLCGFYVNFSSREFVILYSDVNMSCVVVPFDSVDPIRDYSVLPHDIYVRGEF